MQASGQKVQFKVFESGLKSWGTLFQEAASFAESVGVEQLISISHSADGGRGVIAVWYWSDEPRVTES
jgi:hypothetical protein